MHSAVVMLKLHYVIIPIFLHVLSSGQLYTKALKASKVQYINVFRVQVCSAALSRFKSSNNTIQGVIAQNRLPHYETHCPIYLSEFHLFVLLRSDSKNIVSNKVTWSASSRYHV